MVRLIAHYDGKVLVPAQPVDLPTGVPLQVTVQTDEQGTAGDAVQALDGLGREVWGDVDPLEYQRQERKGWE